jgi:hypothetical protein
MRADGRKAISSMKRDCPRLLTWTATAMARPRAQPASNDDDYHPPRRSSRNRQPSRRPDEPVTFVVPTREEDEMDTSDSDQSSSHPFPSPAQLIGRQSRDNSVEILEGPQHTQTVVDGKPLWCT